MSSLQILVSEQKLRTQRVLGQLIEKGQEDGEIATQAINGGGIQSGLPDGQSRKKITDLGITHKQSSKFQKIASIPEDKFEQFIEDGKSKVNEAVNTLTTTAAVRFAKD